MDASTIPSGELLSERALPDALRARLGRARQSLVEGRATRVGSAAQVEDGGLWFSDGAALSLTVMDELRSAFPALGFLAGAASGIYAAHLFSEGDEMAWLWAAVTLVLAASGIAAAVLNSTRAERAAARMQLGTLLLPDAFVYLSYGRAVVIPRAQVVATDLVTIGTSEHREQVRAVYFRRPRDTENRIQHISGFLRDEGGVEQLRRWIDDARRSSSRK